MTADIVTLFDTVADRYDRTGADFFGPMAAHLVARAGIGAGDTVLDVGCGRGAVTFRAAATGARVIALDRAPTMVELTAAEAGDRPGVLGAVGDGQDPPVRTGAADVVTAGLVLFFLPDPAVALGAYARVLRPGGRVALSTFAAHDPGYDRAIRVLRGYAGLTAAIPPLDPLFDSAAALGAGLTAAGFGGVEHTEHEIRTAFRDPGHWYGWVGSHAGARVIDRIPAVDRSAALAAAAAELGDPIVLRTVVRVTTAVRAQVRNLADGRGPHPG